MTIHVYTVNDHSREVLLLLIKAYASLYIATRLENTASTIISTDRILSVLVAMWNRSLQRKCLIEILRIKSHKEEKKKATRPQYWKTNISKCPETGYPTLIYIVQLNNSTKTSFIVICPPKFIATTGIFYTCYGKQDLKSSESS